MRNWLEGYKRHFIRIYFVENPDLGFRYMHILLVSEFVLIGLCFYFRYS